MAFKSTIVFLFIFMISGCASRSAEEIGCNCGPVIKYHTKSLRSPCFSSSQHIITQKIKYHTEMKISSI